jgi:hypothetical protein
MLTDNKSELLTETDSPAAPVLTQPNSATLSEEQLREAQAKSLAQPQALQQQKAQQKAQQQKAEQQKAKQAAQAFRMRFSADAMRSFVPVLNQVGKKVLLHVGAGSPNNRPLPMCFQGEDWAEVRVDINRAVKPHIVASVTDMKGVPDGQSHGVFSSHTHEHLNDFEVAKGFSEILRVLVPGGFVLMNVPDLGQIAQMIVDGKADEVLYDSKAGPIRPIDMLFGHQRSIKDGNGYMAHRTGFTAERLQRFCIEAGFSDVRVRKGRQWDLWLVAVK